ncbi:MFS transporter [Candidatus Saganbacteria bacterium]|nr:MFS transporter [Candidatus Saganbacteria bacterium]
MFKISKNVFLLSLVSFFNDIASEMIYPIVPIFLTTVLGAPVAAVGLIEGIAESTSSLMKIVSGWLSDKFQKRKPFVVLGYSLSTLSKILIGLAYAWPWVLFSRFIDRFGKGTRTAARDALITEFSEKENRAAAFGFHRALDTFGAAAGPLIGIFLLGILDNNYRSVFFIASLPCIFAIFFLLWVKDASAQKTNSSPSVTIKDINPSFKIFLFINIIFALGNSSDAFLILRSHNLGLSVSLTVLAYVLFNLTYAVFSYPLGIISDKIGIKKVLLAGFLLFALVYFLFGLANASFYVWILFPLYGIHMALNEGLSKAYLSLLVPRQIIGTAYGIFQAVIGVCTFFASLFAGLLWSFFNPAAPFIYGGILALISALLFVILEKRIRRPAT